MAVLRGKPSIANLHKVLRTVERISDKKYSGGDPKTISKCIKGRLEGGEGPYRVQYHLVMDYANFGPLSFYSCGLYQLAEESVQ